MRSILAPYGAVAAVVTFALAGAASARADTTDGQALTSANWAGYEVDASSPDQQFSKVSGSWVQPNADCSSGGGDAAFWVGLGGGGSGATGLEQVGTEVDCSGEGDPQSQAWYELIPAAPVPLDLTITPGDHVSASVEVEGNAVTVALKDDTTGKGVTKNLTTQNIDVSSAEWVAEAPSACDSESGCQPVTLANFGQVAITNASATAADHSGTISDPQWSGSPLQLAAADGASGGAMPSSLSDNGGSFTVAWQQGATQSTQPDPSAGGHGGGYGGGGWDGYGGGSPYGYGADPGFSF